jgi:hypothetical protein
VQPDFWFSVDCPGPLGRIVRQLGSGVGVWVGVSVTVNVAVAGAGVAEAVGVPVRVGVNAIQLPEGEQKAPNTGTQPPLHIPLTGRPQTSSGRLHWQQSFAPGVLVAVAAVVGVRVGVSEAVVVGLAVRVELEVAVGVTDAVGVGVAVFVGDGVNVVQLPLSKHTALNTTVHPTLHTPATGGPQDGNMAPH